MVTELFGCYTAGATWNCCWVGACSVYTTQPCTSLQWHFIRSHIHRTHVCLAVTCHMHVLVEWPGYFTCYCGNTWWNGYRNQQRKLTLEKKIIPPLLLELDPETFDHEPRRSNHWAIPAPWLSGIYELPLSDTAWIHPYNLITHGRCLLVWLNQNIICLYDLNKNIIYVTPFPSIAVQIIITFSK